MIALLYESGQGIREKAVKAITQLGGVGREALPCIGELWLDNELDSNVVFQAFLGMGDARCIDYVFQRLFRSPTDGKRNRNDIDSLLSDLTPLSSLNQQVIDWIFKASSFEHRYRGYSYDAGYITIEASDEAIKSLCAINSPVISNILHLVAKKRDISVHMSTGCGEDWDQTVSFDTQRAAAQRELQKRGNPPYLPDVYARAEDTGQLNQMAQAATQAEKARRYRFLLSLVDSPRSGRGEDKWTYYSKNFKTIEVFRLLATDLSQYRYITPSELSSLVGCLIKVGQNLNESDVRDAMSAFQRSWPLAYTDVIEGIKRTKTGE